MAPPSQFVLTTDRILSVKASATPLTMDSKESLISPRLPLELWIMILKLVVAQPWEEKYFLPPPDDFSLLLGFQHASEESNTLSKLMGESSYLSVRLRSADVLGHMASLIPLKSIKHMMLEKPSASGVHDFSRIFELCENITSLSVPPIGKSSWELFTSACHTTGMRNKLRRFDIWYDDYKNWGTLLIDFPNLTELRLAKRDARFPYRHLGLPDRSIGSSWIRKEDRWKYLACTLANSLRHLQKLEFLSLHVTLDSQEDLLNIRMAHKLRHSEESDKNYSNCPLCITEYKLRHAEESFLAENSATMVLARTLGALKRVSWTDAFAQVWFEEHGQRSTNIQRNDDGNIVLQRDDGGHGNAEDLDAKNNWMFVMG